MGLPQNKTKNTAALPPKDIIELETFSHLWMVTDNFLKSSEPVVWLYREGVFCFVLTRFDRKISQKLNKLVKNNIQDGLGEELS